MPLLRKKEFQKTSIPELLRDDEEVFHCEVTNEIFRDYDEFCQRVILVNSMVWQCSMTGKSNLTYSEARQSEEAAVKSLSDFPVELKVPVLFLATKTKRTSFSDIVEDVFSFVKDRYFVGEIVESTFTENNWRESHVLQVIAPSGEQIEEYNKFSKSPERGNFIPSTLYRYEVEQLDANDQDSSQSMVVDAAHIRRRKGPYTKEKHRLFLKQHVEQSKNGNIFIKDSVIKKFNLENVKFDQIFDGPLPDFENMKKPKVAVNGKKVKQETLSKYLEKSANNHTKTVNKNLLEEMRRKEQEYKEKCEAMKQKRAEEKLIESQKKKEERLKVLSYVKEWYKPRDDLELEDQKKLPVPTPVQSKILPKYFGDALMVIEFVNSFSSLLCTRDYFPGGLTLDLLERALMEKEIAGPFTDIVQMFLSKLFNIQDKEAAENTESQASTDLNSDDVDSMTLSETTRLATLAMNWSTTYQGMPLGRLPLYPLTISEVLRLHLLSSGARLNEAASKWRYQQRGGYTSEDDPGLTLRVKHPHIIKALAIHNVNQLPIGDKIKILTCLVDQLLTYADVRDIIDERADKLRQVKVDMKALQMAEKRCEQELASAKIRIKRDNKGRPDFIKSSLDKVQEDYDKKRIDLELQNKALMKTFSELQVMLGTDRSYQRYIKIDSLPGFFVEKDERNPGTCQDKIITQKPELVDAGRTDTLNYVKKLYEECNGSDKENDNRNHKAEQRVNGVKSPMKMENGVDSTRELLMCTAGIQPCPVHSTENTPQWSFFHEAEDIPRLISSLNRRGYRESELRQVLESDTDHIEEIVAATNVRNLNPSLDVKMEEDLKKPIPRKVQNMYSRYEDSNLGFPPETLMAEILELSLVENILEMEEKLFSGSLGSLKVKDRNAWRSHLTNRRYNEMDKTLIRKEEHSQVEKLKAEGKNSRPGTPDSVYKDPGVYLGSTLDYDLDNCETEGDTQLLTLTNEQLTAVKSLATALVQLGQAVDPKYLKKPLGHANVSQKAKEEFNVLERWEQSLLASTSYSQVFLHFGTLENCVMWTRSVLLARCSICHRGGAPESMLLCDSCNKGYHMYCLKPKLTVVPKGDWYCDKCRPKEVPVTTRAAKRARKIFTEASDDEEEEEQEEDQQQEENNESDDYKENGADISVLEVCEECGSGGHVICCDFCPKVYHLECTRPPLRRVPRGEWKCHKCKRRDDRNRDSACNEYDDLDVDGEESEEQGAGLRSAAHRRCATRARHKIHGFIMSLRRNSVDSGTSEETPTQRRSLRRTHDSKGGIDEDDGLPLHNAPLQELLADVMKHQDAWPFTRPVTKHEVPDYYDIITKPMDFGTIKYKLNMGEYRCDADVMADAALVFENCDTYNNAEALVYKCGVRLLRYFEKRCRELGLKFPSGLMGEETEQDGPTEPKKMKTD